MLRQSLRDEPLPYPPNIPLLIQRVHRMIEAAHLHRTQNVQLIARTQGTLAKAQDAIRRSQAARAQREEPAGSSPNGVNA